MVYMPIMVFYPLQFNSYSNLPETECLFLFVMTNFDYFYGKYGK